MEAESKRGDSDEEDEPLEERTAKQTSRVSVPEIVIKQPTTRKAPGQITDLEGTYEINPEDLNILGHELNKAKNALEEFYMQHRPAATLIEDSPIRFQILVKEVQKLRKAMAAKRVPVGYPVTPAEDTATAAAPAALSQAPKKGKEKASTPRQVLHTLGDSFLPKAPPLPDLSSL